MLSSGRHINETPIIPFEIGVYRGEQAQLALRDAFLAPVRHLRPPKSAVVLAVPAWWTAQVSEHDRAERERTRREPSLPLQPEMEKF